MGDAMNITTGQTQRSGPATAGTSLLLLAGPIIWGLHFGTVYFAQSMLCAHGLSDVRIAGVGIVPLIVFVATLIALAGLGAAVLLSSTTQPGQSDSWWSPADDRFRRRVTLVLALLSAFGILWAGATIAVVPACPPIR